MQQIARGRDLFDSVLKMDSLPRRMESLPGDDESDGPAPTVVHEGVTMPKQPNGLEAVRRAANALFSRAFERGLGWLSGRFWSRGGESGLQLEVTSVQTALYLTLLANLNREWRKCKRPDCDVVFFRKSAKEKDYCCHRCAANEVMRNRRARQKHKRDKE